jgi:hydrogenase maturation protease
VTRRILVAGIGNIFFGDDAFGPAVLARLLQNENEDAAGNERLRNVRFEDFGIRGLHLAHELLAGYDAVVIVDAASRGGSPGTLYTIEPSEQLAEAAPDAHRMDLGSVFGFVRLLGGEAPPITIVGCEPESLEEGAELSNVVARAVEAAVPLVLRVVNGLLETKEEVCYEA